MIEPILTLGMNGPPYLVAACDGPGRHPGVQRFVGVAGFQACAPFFGSLRAAMRKNPTDPVNRRRHYVNCRQLSCWGQVKSRRWEFKPGPRELCSGIRRNLAFRCWLDFSALLTRFAPRLWAPWPEGSLPPARSRTRPRATVRTCPSVGRPGRRFVEAVTHLEAERAISRPYRVRRLL